MFFNASFKRIVSVALALTTVVGISIASSRYSVTYFGLRASSATGISDNGHVAITGMTTQGGIRWHAYHYFGGTTTDIGGLGTRSTVARAVNSSGQVVGVSDVNANIRHAYVYQNGTVIDLGTLGGEDSWAEAINEAGHIVGYAQTWPWTSSHAFLYANGVMTDLGSFVTNDSSWANDINNVGQVVGSSITSSGGEHAFIWKAGVMVDIGTLGGSGSEATAINDLGHVVGTASVAGSDTRHPFIYKNGLMTDIGLQYPGVPTYAEDINDSGQIVGWSWDGWSVGGAFLFENGAMANIDELLDAPSSGWHISEALAINNNGTIVGSGNNASLGLSGAVMLTPVPEPSVAAVLTCGIWLLKSRRIHSRRKGN
ncbi:MAG: hypothetical protein HZC36_00490 [Armatimonadetes bacterium]|nr:hypothetical protein [Armatimonadota bacterium]